MPTNLIDASQLAEAICLGDGGLLAPLLAY